METINQDATIHEKDLVPLPDTPKKFLLRPDKRPIASLSCGSSILKRDACYACYYDFGSNRKSVVFSKNQIWASYDHEGFPRRYARINWVNNNEHLPFRLGVTWLKPVPATKDERRWCEVGLPVACGHFHLKGGNMVVSDSTVFSHMISRFLEVEEVEISPKEGEVWALFEDWRPSAWCDDPEKRKGCKYAMVEILRAHPKNGGVTVVRLAKVQGFRSVFQRCKDAGGGPTFTAPANHLLHFSHNVPAFRFSGGEIDGASDGMLELDPATVPDDLLEDDVAKPSKGGSSSDSSSFSGHVPVSIPVTSDTEITSMNHKWSKEDFVKDQIWAVYDGPDSLPRHYVIVHSVISGAELCTALLDLHPRFDVEICWMRENLPSVCGLFKIGKTMIVKMSQFSHVVSGEVCTRKSLYKIYPKKGEVWAVYKSWHPKWRKCDYKNYQCQIVEVLTDFCEDDGVKVASLVDVSDYMTFFQRQVCNGFELIRTISRMEMLSFSHQIPCFVIPKIETHGFPEGALHLEPDALSPGHSN